MAHFISLDDMGDLTPVEHDGAPVTARYERLLARLDQFLPDGGGLFAEPVWAGRAEGQAAQVSWYTRYEGEAVAFASLPPAEQALAQGNIRRVLDELAPLLRDKAFGPFLGRCLVMPDLEDLLLIGGRPVLRNWGWVLGAEPEALERAWVNGLGRFLPGSRLPWLVAEEAAPIPAGTPAGPAPPPKPRGPAWWTRAAVALPVMLVLLLAGAAASYAFWKSREVKLTDAELAEQTQLGERQALLAERTGAFSGALKASLCTAAAAETAPIDAGSAAQLLAHAMARVVVPGMPAPVRGTAFFVAKDRLVTPAATLAGIGGRPVFVESYGIGAGYRAEPVPGADNAPFAVLRLSVPARNAAPLAFAPGAVPGTATYAGALPAYANPRDISLDELQEGDVRESPAALVSAGTLAAVRGAAPSLPPTFIPPGSEGAPVIDACGRVLGVASRAAASRVAPDALLLDMLHQEAAGTCLAVPPAPPPAAPGRAGAP